MNLPPKDKNNKEKSRNHNPKVSCKKLMHKIQTDKFVFIFTFIVSFQNKLTEFVNSNDNEYQTEITAESVVSKDSKSNK